MATVDRVLVGLMFHGLMVRDENAGAVLHLGTQASAVAKAHSAAMLKDAVALAQAIADGTDAANAAQARPSASASDIAAKAAAPLTSQTAGK